MFENIVLFVSGMVVYHFLRPFVIQLFKIMTEIYNNAKENTQNG